MIFSSQIYSQFLNRLWNTFACWYLISSLNIILQFNSHKVQDSCLSSNLMIYLKTPCESNWFFENYTKLPLYLLYFIWYYRISRIRPLQYIYSNITYFHVKRNVIWKFDKNFTLVYWTCYLLELIKNRRKFEIQCVRDIIKEVFLSLLGITTKT